MKLSAVSSTAAAITRDVTVHFSDEDVLEASIRPAALTRELRHRLNTVQEEMLRVATADGPDAGEAYGVDTYATALAAIVATWDLEDADGNPLAPTVEVLSAVDLGELMVLFAKIMEAVQALPLERTSPRSGSSGPTARKPRRR